MEDISLSDILLFSIVMVPTTLATVTVFDHSFDCIFAMLVFSLGVISVLLIVHCQKYPEFFGNDDLKTIMEIQRW
ncbi:hypothetical protein evm_014853 [Chilo suppressalis]|nr:hypothetical protein evm_014853 [Chilo suppressalis]